MMTHDSDTHDFDALHEDDQAAYVFQAKTPATATAQETQRPQKRRRLARNKCIVSSPSPSPEPACSSSSHLPTPSARHFEPLFDGRESPDCVKRRLDTYLSCWGRIETTVGRVLREANANTLDQVEKFVSTGNQGEGQAAGALDGRIPAAFVITGPNVALQELLFEQLGDALRGVDGGGNRFVRLRAVDVGGSLKNVLKKIIKDGMSRAAVKGNEGRDGEGEDEELEQTRSIGGRKYLDYDLDALAAIVKTQRCRHIFVAFQDSEGFDGGLLSDIVRLFSTWRSRIPFTLLFGIATSVELLQTRLLKSTVRHLYGAQFDVVQANAILERVLRHAVAGNDVVLRLGPSLLRTLLERQQDQVAGVQAFISSIKYAHMCHFYANPLSALIDDDGGGDGDGEGKDDASFLQKEHVDAIRTLGSFRDRVEIAIAEKRLDEARALLVDDGYLVQEIRHVARKRRAWATALLRCLHVFKEICPHGDEYSNFYLGALEGGIDLGADDAVVRDPIRRMQADDLVALMKRVEVAIESGDSSVGLDGWASQEPDFVASVTALRHKAEALRKEAEQQGAKLRSKYNSQSKIMRATVVAQRVQLTHDSAQLTDQDKQFTQVVDDLVDVLTANVRCEAASAMFLHEIWLYDSRSPLREAFVPRPRATFERSLRRPHDYLGCSCCGSGGNDHDDDDDDDDNGLKPTLPTVALLYRLYLETGNLINVADLWSAFYGVVGEENGEGGLDEKTALVRFYQGLAQLKAMGFVKPSKRKVDHIAKLKWL